MVNIGGTDTAGVRGVGGVAPRAGALPHSNNPKLVESATRSDNVAQPLLGHKPLPKNCQVVLSSRPLPVPGGQSGEARKELSKQMTRRVAAGDSGTPVPRDSIMAAQQQSPERPLPRPPGQGRGYRPPPPAPSAPSAEPLPQLPPRPTRDAPRPPDQGGVSSPSHPAPSAPSAEPLPPPPSYPAPRPPGQGGAIGPSKPLSQSPGPTAPLTESSVEENQKRFDDFSRLGAALERGEKLTSGTGASKEEAFVGPIDLEVLQAQIKDIDAKLRSPDSNKTIRTQLTDVRSRLESECISIAKQCFEVSCSRVRGMKQGQKSIQDVAKEEFARVMALLPPSKQAEVYRSLGNSESQKVKDAATEGLRSLEGEMAATAKKSEAATAVGTPQKAPPFPMSARVLAQGILDRASGKKTKAAALANRKIFEQKNQGDAKKACADMLKALFTSNPDDPSLKPLLEHIPKIVTGLGTALSVLGSEELLSLTMDYVGTHIGPIKEAVRELEQSFPEENRTDFSAIDEAQVKADLALIEAFRNSPRKPPALGNTTEIAKFDQYMKDLDASAGRLENNFARLRLSQSGDAYFRPAVQTFAKGSIEPLVKGLEESDAYKGKVAELQTATEALKKAATPQQICKAYKAVEDQESAINELIQRTIPVSFSVMEKEKTDLLQRAKDVSRTAKTEASQRFLGSKEVLAAVENGKRLLTSFEVQFSAMTAIQKEQFLTSNKLNNSMKEVFNNLGGSIPAALREMLQDAVFDVGSQIEKCEQYKNNSTPPPLSLNEYTGLVNGALTRMLLYHSGERSTSSEKLKELDGAKDRVFGSVKSTIGKLFPSTGSQPTRESIQAEERELDAKAAAFEADLQPLTSLIEPLVLRPRGKSDKILLGELRSTVFDMNSLCSSRLSALGTARTSIENALKKEKEKEPASPYIGQLERAQAAVNAATESLSSWSTKVEGIISPKMKEMLASQKVSNQDKKDALAREEGVTGESVVSLLIDPDLTAFLDNLKKLNVSLTGDPQAHEGECLNAIFEGSSGSMMKGLITQGVSGTHNCLVLGLQSCVDPEVRKGMLARKNELLKYNR